MSIPTWLEAKAKLSVAVNRTYLLFQNVPDAMSRFVRPAAFSTGDDLFELQTVGSAFMGEHRGLRFAISTAHQASAENGAPHPGKFVVVVKDDGRRLAVPPDAAHKTIIEDPEQHSMTDLMFYDYSTTNSPIPLEHLDLSGIRWSDSNDVADYSFLVGFPSASAKIQLTDSLEDPRITEYTLRWIRQDLETAPRELLDPPDRLIFVKHSRSTRSSVAPDGLSGSPVFSIVADANGDRHLRFDGIVTDARGDRFAIYPSAVIRGLLDDIVDRKIAEAVSPKASDAPEVTMPKPGHPTPKSEVSPVSSRTN